MSELVIRTEDGEDVTVGSRVFCYYDGHWGTIQAIVDERTGRGELGAANRNQDYWADVQCDDEHSRSYNGQRLAVRDPNGSIDPTTDYGDFDEDFDRTFENINIFTNDDGEHFNIALDVNTREMLLLDGATKITIDMKAGTVRVSRNEES